MPKPAPPAPPPTPAARVVFGVAHQVRRAPPGIASPATEALQSIARAARSSQPQRWGVFPVYGRDVVVAGYLSARTPQRLDATWMVEPGGALAREHHAVAYVRSQGASVGRPRDERYDADCVEDFLRELAGADAWRALDAAPLDPSTLPGGDPLIDPRDPTFFLLTDDGRGADVVYGMSFWRPGDTYAAGRVETWTRPVDDDDAVRVVGARVARVDRETPLRVAPAAHTPDDDAIRRETRAVLDSDRPFAWYFIADPAG